MRVGVVVGPVLIIRINNGMGWDGEGRGGEGRWSDRLWVVGKILMCNTRCILETSGIVRDYYGLNAHREYVVRVEDPGCHVELRLVDRALTDSRLLSRAHTGIYSHKVL